MNFIRNVEYIDVTHTEKDVDEIFYDFPLHSFDVHDSV